MGTLTKETLELLQRTAVDAAGAKNKAHPIPLEAEPDHVYGIIDAEGELLRFEAEPEPRAHTLVTLDEVLRFAKHADGQPTFPARRLIEGPTAPPLGEDPASIRENAAADALDDADEDTPPPQTIVWYDRPAIVVILDDLTRRDRATMALNFTPQLERLIALEDNEAKMEQRAFRRLLKIDLADCRQDDVLLNWVSHVKFTGNTMAAGKIGQGKESFGRAVDDEATSDFGECPDEITLQLRVFDDPSLRGTWPVRCAVEVFPAESSFRLVPLPLELHNAIEAELSVIGQHLTEGLSCPVFRGRP